MEENKIYIGKDGRYRIYVRNNKFMSYPKYLMEQHLGRKIEEPETVHHIDGNFANNNIENLEIINRRDHAKQDAIRRKPVFKNCVWCDKFFKLSIWQVANYNRRKKTAGPFCCRKCSGKYGKAIQLNKQEPLERDAIQVEYYRERDLN